MIASLLGVGGGLGVIVAGVLVEHLSYTSMFWVQLPAFAAVAWAVHRWVPESARDRRRRGSTGPAPCCSPAAS